MSAVGSSVMSYLDSGILNALRSYLVPSGDKKKMEKTATSWSPHECEHPLNSLKPDSKTELGKRLNRIYGGKYGDWLRSFGVTPSWETPCDTLEIHIWHGYRPNPCSVWYSLKSAFYPTNEAINIWTHFIPFLMMLYRTYRIFTSLDDPTNIIYYPFWIHCFGCCYVLIVSSLAHVFNSLSGHAQEFCMCYDYGAISVYGLTNVIAYELYVCPRSCFFATNLSTLQFVVGFTFLGYVTNGLSCWSRHPKCPYYLILRFLPIGLCYVITSLPCVVKYFTGLTQNSSDFGGPIMCNVGLGDFHWLFPVHCLMYFFSIFFTTTRFPEKYYPGSFDIVGHSHQFFHIFIALGLYTQNLLVENVLREVDQQIVENNLAAEDISVSPWNSLYPISMYVVVSAILVCTFSSMLGKDLHHRRAKKIK
uniref:Membrane progestin receptor gamma-B-like n=1 Tax=Phallusia mammillata TaxID=59560 RepID=A0A6F9DMH5_9ASCI|nr:membrane progestin receptor gamma-B-like [Phallusia mammillata]